MGPGGKNIKLRGDQKLASGEGAICSREPGRICGERVVADRPPRGGSFGDEAWDCQGSRKRSQIEQVVAQATRLLGPPGGL